MKLEEKKIVKTREENTENVCIVGTGVGGLTLAAILLKEISEQNKQNNMPINMNIHMIEKRDLTFTRRQKLINNKLIYRPEQKTWFDLIQDLFSCCFLPDF